MKKLLTILLTLFLSTSLIAVGENEGFSGRVVDILSVYNNKYVVINSDKTSCLYISDNSIKAVAQGVYKTHSDRLIECDSVADSWIHADNNKLCIEFDEFELICKKINKSTDGMLKFGKDSNILDYDIFDQQLTLSLIYRNGLAFKLGETQPFTGRLVTPFDTDMAITRNNHQCGRRSNIKEISDYRNGVKHGNYIICYKDGYPQYEYHYIGGMKEKTANIYDDYNKLHKTIDYKNDLKHGKEVTYFRSEIALEVFNYKNGKRHGSSRLYNFDTRLTSKRKLSMTIDYKDGKIITQLELPAKPKFKQNSLLNKEAVDRSVKYFEIGSFLIAVDEEKHLEHNKLAIKFLERSAYLGNYRALGVLLQYAIKKGDIVKSIVLKARLKILRDKTLKLSTFLTFNAFNLDLAKKVFPELYDENHALQLRNK